MDSVGGELACFTLLASSLPQVRLLPGHARPTHRAVVVDNVRVQARLAMAVLKRQAVNASMCERSNRPTLPCMTQPKHWLICLPASTCRRCTGRRLRGPRSDRARVGSRCTHSTGSAQPAAPGRADSGTRTGKSTPGDSLHRLRGRHPVAAQDRRRCSALRQSRSFAWLCPHRTAGTQPALCPRKTRWCIARTR